MTSLEKFGANHESRLAIMETIAARSESLMWRMFTPVLAALSGIVTALVVWFLIGR